MATPSVPPSSTSPSATQQFVVAAIGLGAAVDQMGTGLDELKTQLHDQSVTHSTELASVRTKVDQTEGRVNDLVNKPPDRWKGVQTGLSAAALVVSLISAAFTIKFANDNYTLADNNSKLMVKNKELTDLLAKTKAEKDVLALIREMGALVREAQPPAPHQDPSPAYLSVKERYTADANAVDIDRNTQGFADIGENNFATLMRVAIAFNDTEYAPKFWSSVDSIKAPRTEDKVELALVHAAYAKLMNKPEEMKLAVNRIEGVSLGPEQASNVHYGFAEMYKSFGPSLSDTAYKGLKNEIRELDKLKVDNPQLASDIDAHTASYRLLLTNYENARRPQPKTSTTTTGQP